MILIPLGETPGEPMSAPALRRFETGRGLSNEFDVVFAVNRMPEKQVDLGNAACVEMSNRSEFARALQESRFLYTLGIQPTDYLTIARSGVRVILDLYVPRAFEVLEASPQLSEAVVRAEHRRDLYWAQSGIRLADYLVATNQYQRDFWIGFLAGCRLLDVADARQSPNLDSRIGIVPHGIRERQFEPAGERPGPLRTSLGIGEDDLVLLWSSRVLAWQDPVVLMRAMKELVSQDPSIRLVLLGVGRLPDEREINADGHAWRTRQAVEAAQATGLLGSHIFFVEERVPHSELAAWYADCDVAVGTYPDSLETHYCLATRLLDYVSADLPTILSGLDVQRDLMKSTGAGVVVPPGDVEALVNAVLKMRCPETRRDCIAEMRQNRRHLNWELITEPIRRYLRSAPSSRREPLSRVSCVARLAGFYARHAAFLARRARDGGRTSR